MLHLKSGVIPLSPFGLGIFQRYATLLIGAPEKQDYVLEKVERTLKDMPIAIEENVRRGVLHLVQGSNGLEAPALTFSHTAHPDALNLVLGNKKLDPAAVDLAKLDTYSDEPPPAALKFNLSNPETAIHLHYFKEGRPTHQLYVPLHVDRLADFSSFPEETLDLGVKMLAGQEPWHGIAATEIGDIIIAPTGAHPVTYLAHLQGYNFIAMNLSG